MIPGPAALYLLQNGVTGAQLARELGVSRQAVSLHLAGKTAKTPPELLEKVADLAGDETARTLELVIAKERE